MIDKTKKVFWLFSLIYFVKMKISDFDYELPEDLIAQEPLERRENSRMMVVSRAENSWTNEQFVNFPNYLRETDVLVLNNTKVFPARLLGEKETGAGIELFLVREIENQIWETLARPARRLKTGTVINFGKKLRARVLEKTNEGHVVVHFESEGNFEEVLDEIGKTPLPPYIKRGDGNFEQDRDRYQTVFAKERGVKVVEITLHVGYGTFEPVRVSDLSQHKVLPEQCEISLETAAILNRAKAENSRIIAVGTTTTRALESSVAENGNFFAGKRLADLTITPGYKFRAIDGLLTNFHLPQSSLLVLVSTFAGYDLIMNSYKHAVESRYRFYSYGDCMLII